MREQLEMRIERKTAFDCNEKIEDAFWVYGPSPSDLWKAEPDPNAYDRMSELEVFFKTPSNECYLLKVRHLEYPGKPHVIGAAPNEIMANSILYETALNFAREEAKRMKIPLVDLT